MTSRARAQWTYVVRRLLQVVPLVFVIVLVNFTLIHLAPGDPVNVLVGEGASVQYRERIRHQYGLDQPLGVQFVRYANELVHLNLGYSNRFKEDVWPLIVSRIPATLLLVGTGFILSSLVGVFLGILAARRPDSVIDQLATLVSVAGQSVPVFWLAIILLLVFGVWLNWFPIQGIVSVREETVGFARVLDVASHLLLPVLTFSVSQVTLIFRLTRSKMREMLLQDFVTMARAKGLPERSVVYRHALPNAFLPILTLIAFNFGFMLAGATLIETVFAWPGTGLLMFNAIHARDYPLILGLFTVVSTTVILTAVVTDVLYAAIDPRIAYGSRR